MEKSFITTAFDFEGCKIVKNMGIVRGIVVRSRNFFANIGAGFQTLVGGDITFTRNSREDEIRRLNAGKARRGTQSKCDN